MFQRFTKKNDVMIRLPTQKNIYMESDNDVLVYYCSECFSTKSCQRQGGEFEMHSTLVDGQPQSKAGGMNFFF